MVGRDSGVSQDVLRSPVDGWLIEMVEICHVAEDSQMVVEMVVSIAEGSQMVEEMVVLIAEGSQDVVRLKAELRNYPAVYKWRYASRPALLYVCTIG
jgi:hypothetical protein